VKHLILAAILSIVSISAPLIFAGSAAAAKPLSILCDPDPGTSCG
jgi:hypothetical protein